MEGRNEEQGKLYIGAMVSSTFDDVRELRKALLEALRKEEFFAIGMEENIPIASDDVLSVSLKMTRKASAYICLIGHKYGQVPTCPTRNPNDYSITRIEYEEAQRLSLPTIVFIMGNSFKVRKQDVETDPLKITKLESFREFAKSGKIYYTFESEEEFRSQAIHAIAALRRTLGAEKKAQDTEIATRNVSAPVPPEFYAKSPYIGSHEFIGRLNQLESISDWASSSDSHPVLLFEAIGGTGKSILSWEWVTNHAPQARSDWAGVFWYSFYERGATTADFCRELISYMTGKSIYSLKDQSTLDLLPELLELLNVKPWLIVLDGLERILVSYHRYDAAQLKDEEAGNEDLIAERDPCSSINPEDDELLKSLTKSDPSKILLTSRLTPKCLLNPSGQPIPGC